MKKHGCPDSKFPLKIFQFWIEFRISCYQPFAGQFSK